MLIYINFNFDFLGLDNVYFENYFANEHIATIVRFKPFKTLTAHVLSQYKTLVFVSHFISDKALLLVLHHVTSKTSLSALEASPTTILDIFILLYCFIRYIVFWQSSKGRFSCRL